MFSFNFQKRFAQHSRSRLHLRVFLKGARKLHRSHGVRSLNVECFARHSKWSGFCEPQTLFSLWEMWKACSIYTAPGGTITARKSTCSSVVRVRHHARVSRRKLSGSAVMIDSSEWNPLPGSLNPRQGNSRFENSETTQRKLCRSTRSGEQSNAEWLRFSRPTRIEVGERGADISREERLRLESV